MVEYERLVPSLAFGAFLLFPSFATQSHAEESIVTLGITSVYTDLKINEDCVTLSTDDLGGTLSCPGFGGYGATITEADLRLSVFYGDLGSWYLEGAWESFQTFNNIGTTLEWRLEDGVPFATILRWTIEFSPGDEAQNGEILVVSKVGQPGEGEACIVGYVDARGNENANELARDIADELAIDFQCRVETPEYRGAQGFMTGIPVRSFGP
ncbi:MAG: hypothetical protein AAGI92_05055 [Pseudomonadota bacterium]